MSRTSKYCYFVWFWIRLPTPLPLRSACSPLRQVRLSNELKQLNGIYINVGNVQQWKAIATKETRKSSHTMVEWFIFLCKDLGYQVHRFVSPIKDKDIAISPKNMPARSPRYLSTQRIVKQKSTSRMIKMHWPAEKSTLDPSAITAITSLSFMPLSLPPSGSCTYQIPRHSNAGQARLPQAKSSVQHSR